MSRPIVWKTMDDLKRVPFCVHAQNFRVKQWHDPEFKAEVLDFIDINTTAAWGVQMMGGWVSFYFENEQDALLFKLRHG